MLGKPPYSLVTPGVIRRILATSSPSDSSIALGGCPDSDGWVDSRGYWEAIVREEHSRLARGGAEASVSPQKAHLGDSVQYSLPDTGGL